MLRLRSIGTNSKVAESVNSVEIFYFRVSTWKKLIISVKLLLKEADLFLTQDRISNAFWVGLIICFSESHFFSTIFLVFLRFWKAVILRLWRIISSSCFSFFDLGNGTVGLMGTVIHNGTLYSSWLIGWKNKLAKDRFSLSAIVTTSQVRPIR